MAATQPTSEPLIGIESREQLLYLLAEAAEIEHNLMCCYLFAAFSLKSGADEDLTAGELEAVRRWHGGIIAVAVEEMAHLALVGNLTTALGGAAHFGRPNLPSAAGLYPSGIVVKLAPFDRETLQHFLFLERPEGHDTRDGAGFSVPSDYARDTVRGKCMPSAQDYLTVGHLYRALADGLRALVAHGGEDGTFIGDPTAQVGPDIVKLPGLSVVKDLQSALKAIDTIVQQGEGASVASPESHYGRFLGLAQEYDELLKRRAAFVPNRPVARNPVMRRPPTAGDKVFIEAPDAACVLDLANALYGQMLRCLAQGFGRSGEPGSKLLLIDTAVELMFSVGALAEFLTRLPASPDCPGETAGITFAMLRDVSRVPEGSAEWRLVSERLGELAAAAGKMTNLGPPLVLARENLLALKVKFDQRSLGFQPNAQRPSESPVAAVEVARGQSLTIKFEAKRCIHSRFCVLGLPEVYKANVQGPWLTPDAASVEANIGVAHNCPSGAIQYDRHDGGPQEAAPSVNLIGLRENGPYAFRAPLVLDGRALGYRATLCRCGASKNKPFCDGAHHVIGFVATAEPSTGVFAALVERAGPLEVSSQTNGPLKVSGNAEIISGTGRTLMKTRSTALCRCGHSANKPYCDGTHARIGFISG